MPPTPEETWSALVARADLHVVGRDWARLDATAREMIACDPQHEFGYRHLAEAASWRGDCAQAVAYGREAVARAPQSAYAHCRLATFQRLAGDLRTAREHVEAALALDAGYSHSWAERGRIALAERDPQSAQRYADRALELDPGDAWHHHLRATTLSRETSDEKRLALEAYRTVLRQDPEHHATWSEVAQLHLDLHEPREAETAVVQALELDPRNDDYRNLLYDVLRQRSRIYVALVGPGEAVVAGMGLIARLPASGPWACLGLVALPALAVLIALGLIWVVLAFPAIWFYQWMTLADIRRHAREIAPMSRRLHDVHRWPFTLRIGLFLMVVVAFWYGVWRLFQTKTAWSVLVIATVGAMVLAIVVGILVEAGESRRKRQAARRDAELDATLQRHPIPQRTENVDPR